MSKRSWILVVGFALLSSPAAEASSAVDSLLQQYQQQGATSFSSAQGKKLWTTEHQQPKLGKAVSCASCHTTDLTHVGSHLRTGKRIEPMSPQVNPKRLTDTANIAKWFRRNCKWSWGRECTPQEKGDILMFIQGEKQ